MRVLSIPHAYAPVRGGAERYAQGVCEQLAALGHTVRVVVAGMASPEAFYSFGIPPLDAPRCETIEGVEVVRVAYGGAGYRILGRALRVLPERRRPAVAARWLRRFGARFTTTLDDEIVRFRPDVVLTLPHLFTNVRSVIALQRRAGFPMVMVPLLHEDDPNWPFEEMRAALRGAAAVIALTPHEAGRLVEAYGVEPARVFECPGGVDVVATPAETERPDMVLYLGRKMATKGLDRLVTAMQTVWATHPAAGLTVAGSPGPGWNSGMLTAALTVEEGSRVTSLDDVTDSVRDHLLATARCLVLPSTNESFGLVVLEAWAKGTPVVVPDIPVFRDTVTHEVDGLLVNPGDDGSLAAAVASLLDDPAKAAAMGQRGREKALAHYTWRQTGERVDDAIRHAVAHPTDRRS